MGKSVICLTIWVIAMEYADTVETKRLIKTFRSVKISYDIIYRIDYCYLAELFRMMGIFVCEDILVETNDSDAGSGTEASTNYSAHIGIFRSLQKTDSACVSQIPQSKEDQDQIKNLPNVCTRLYDLDMFDRQAGDGTGDCSARMLYCAAITEQKSALEKLLKAVLVKAVGTEQYDKNGVAGLKPLVEVFVENKIWFHSMNLQYYPKRRSDVIGEAKDAFLQAHDRIKHILEDQREAYRHLYQYAMLWCEVKVNLACSYQNEILFFFTEKLAERCRNLCAEYPDFDNARVLLGLCYEPSPNSANEALWAFDEALKAIQSECFSASVYYWIGKRYEVYPNRKEEAETAYRLANQCKPKFRTNFKLAVIARGKEDYDEALKLFSEIPEKLQAKLKVKFTDPLELEYLFKVYTQQCYIYYQKGLYLDAIRVGTEAAQVFEKYIGESVFFDRFYGTKGEKDSRYYRGLLKARLNPETVYRLLTDSCKRMLMEEKAKEYRIKALEYENGSKE